MTDNDKFSVIQLLNKDNIPVKSYAYKEKRHQFLDIILRDGAANHRLQGRSKTRPEP
ncbi:MAG: hypothetical protein V3S24_18130 [Candidatus Tectomicrobia bacterium]